MKKLLITLTIICFAFAVKAQQIKKHNDGIDSLMIPERHLKFTSHLNYIGYPADKEYKPIDTVKCIMHLVLKDDDLQTWQKGYVVLRYGGIFTKDITWKGSYIPTALGPFDNVFLDANKKQIGKYNYIIQVTLLEN